MSNILDQLDEFFEKQKKQEQQILFFVPLLVFGFLSFYFLYPITSSYLEDIEYNKDNLESKLSKVKSNISFLKMDNMRYTSNIVNINNTLKHYKNQKIQTDELVAKLGFLRFNIDKWAKFYDEIPKLAKRYNIKLLSLENTFMLQNTHQLVSRKIVLKIKASGNFIDFIKCLNQFETKKEFIKINYLDMKKDSLDIVIYVYGVEL